MGIFGFGQQEIERHVLRMLQLDVLAVRKIDAPLHARADDRFPQLFVIPVMKAVTRKLPFDVVADGNEEGRNIVPEKS